MKLKVFCSLALILLMALSVGAQTKTAMLIGPIWNGENWSLKWGGVKQMSDKVWMGGFGQFGETVEANCEVTFMFEPAPGWLVGPTIGVGIDWSAEPGTAESEELTRVVRASGIATSYAFTEKIGAWGYAEYQAAMEFAGYQDYRPGWTGGLGLWFSP